ncbi:hypothetical protein GS399_19990 [Pedobacter sp. HMF7647]|uniref:DUF502 domain-containing protein n=1 Tax=Hufsiella arboris TaxID=2695275 RepID=A0A7K1YF69_9SPHI|nr:hypothetical protein [Hufsiella arboris]MXV53254.1 hypothetical protein [Hufsiella arboris]
MKSVLRFLKATILGGLLFLAPLVVLIIVFEKAYHLLHRITAPLAANLAGVEFHNLVVIFLLVFICFIFGLISLTGPAKRLIAGLEDKLLSNIPGYTFIKETGAGMMGLSESSTQKVAVALFDDNAQLCFLIEEMENDQRMVYIPGAPSPWTGGIYIMQSDRVKLTGLSYGEALTIIKQLGKGASKIKVSCKLS